MLDRTAAATPTHGAAPPVSRIRAGSIDDAKRCRATLQALLRTREAQSEYLERLVEVAQGKRIHLLLTGPDGVFFGDWESFVVCRLPYGLGVPAGALDAVIRERTDPKHLARRLLREDGVPGQLLLARPGARRASDPATKGTKGPPPGTNRGYWLARLRRDRGDLLQRVEQGELSPLAAAVLAGWTSPLTWVRCTPESFAAQAVKHLTEQGVVALIDYLREPASIPLAQSRRHGTRRTVAPDAG